MRGFFRIGFGSVRTDRRLPVHLEGSRPRSPGSRPPEPLLMVPAPPVPAARGDLQRLRATTLSRPMTPHSTSDNQEE